MRKSQLLLVAYPFTSRRLTHHGRGTNENTNGLLREYFPKGESSGRVSEKRVQEVYDKLNRRPRKRLGYRTPYEVHSSKTLHLI